MLSNTALAHAAFVSVSDSRAVTVRAYFDTGEPMAGAQIAIFAPDSPRQPWVMGAMDEDGRFTFVPSQPGRWMVQARQAGHGAVNYFEWEAGEAFEREADFTQSASLSWIQKLIIVGSLGWGCVGTALYVLRRRALGAA